MNFLNKTLTISIAALTLGITNSNLASDNNPSKKGWIESFTGALLKPVTEELKQVNDSLDNIQSKSDEWMLVARETTDKPGWLVFGTAAYTTGKCVQGAFHGGRAASLYAAGAIGTNVAYQHYNDWRRNKLAEEYMKERYNNTVITKDNK